MSLYPLKFKPRYVQKMWGGRKIESVLGKHLPSGTIGESWEIYDFPPGVVEKSGDWVSAEVAEGPLAGQTLHDILEKSASDLLGSAKPIGPHNQFPLLIKFLDAREDLSVQVHPDEVYAANNPGAHLKNEAWYVVQADPGARLLMGLTPGTTREKFAAAIRSGAVESIINSIPVSAGDCYYLPSGTVHALGAGVLAAEVQTPSDTTYRVFDFNRIDPSTGERRALHIEQAMQCIDFNAPGSSNSRGGELVKCSHFSITKIQAHPGQIISIPSGEMGILIFLAGGGRMDSGRFQPGDTYLLPAKRPTTNLSVEHAATWLHVRPMK